MRRERSRLSSLERLLAYDRAVFERYERSIRVRGWKDAVTNREIGHRTVKDTLAHILNVYEAWLVAIDQGRWEVFEVAGRQPAQIASWADLRAYRARVWQAIDAWFPKITERALRRRVKAPWMPGRYTVEDSFYQVSFEQAHHLGEIIGLYWQLDRPTPPMTWLDYRPRTNSSGPRS